MIAPEPELDDRCDRAGCGATYARHRWRDGACPLAGSRTGYDEDTEARFEPQAGA